MNFEPNCSALVIAVTFQRRGGGEKEQATFCCIAALRRPEPLSSGWYHPGETACSALRVLRSDVCFDTVVRFHIHTQHLIPIPSTSCSSWSWPIRTIVFLLPWYTVLVLAGSNLIITIALT